MALPSPSLARRLPARGIGACAAVLAVLAGGWLWLRDSSLVAVRQVSVSGVSGTDAPRVRAALEDAARDMTTLHVRNGQLATAVEPFPAVIAVDAHPDFPHRLRIVVHEHVAVGAIAAGSGRVAVAADGTLLRDSATAGLPVIDVPVSPGGDAITDRRAVRAVALLAAAPPALRAKVRRVYLGPRGLTAPLQDGPVLYFGGGERLSAKWRAATVVLASRSSAGASYLDLRLPERPAAGGLEAPAPAPPQPAGQAGAQSVPPPTPAAQP
ncbi:MAG TPA: FtsQ-type POTRA domain-containing protein [Solirubrobacteraceae bacterium]